MEKKGFVAVFARALDRAAISGMIIAWLERFEKVEQVIPTEQSTLEVLEPGDLMWEPWLQFRISQADRFAWVYLAMDKKVIETTGFADGEISFCLEILVELPGLTEVVDEKNQRRLDELEKAGLL